MATPNDVVKEYISIIENTVPDPNVARASRTTGRKWVYPDVPNANLGADNYPRISIVNKNSPSTPHNINSHEQRLNVRTEIQIRVKRTKWNNQTAEEFIDALTLKVVDALRLPSSISKLITKADVFQPQLEFENTTYANDVLIKQLVYKNIMKR